MSPNPFRACLEGARVCLHVAVAALILPTRTQGRGAPESLQSGYLAVYGVKTVTPLPTRKEAKERGLQYGDIPKAHVTRLFSVDPLSGQTALVFSDDALPVMVLNREGGGETALYGIVATNPSRRKAIALMGVRPRTGDPPRPIPSLYELSLDGRNAVRRISDVESMIAFAVSRDGEQIAYFLYHPKRLVIRSTGAGTIAAEISLEGTEFADLPSLGWSPDDSLILVRRWPGPEHETQYDLVHILERRVERTGISGEIYSFFPKSNRLLGVHLRYDGSSASPLREFFSMALGGGDTVNLSLPPCRECWHAAVSPDERLIAYPSNQGVAIDALTRGIGPSNTRVPVGHAEVIGWIAR